MPTVITHCAFGWLRAGSVVGHRYMSSGKANYQQNLPAGSTSRIYLYFNDKFTGIFELTLLV